MIGLFREAENRTIFPQSKGRERERRMMGYGLFEKQGTIIIVIKKIPLTKTNNS